MSRVKRIRNGLKSGDLRLVDCRDRGALGRYWVLENCVSGDTEEVLVDIDPTLEALSSGITNRQWAVYHSIAPILRGGCGNKSTHRLAVIMGNDRGVGYETALCGHLKALEVAGFLRSEEDTHGPSGSVLARYWFLTNKRPFNYVDRCIKIRE